MAYLSEEQKRAYNLYNLGHNLLILGHVGCGKTTVVW